MQRCWPALVGWRLLCVRAFGGFLPWFLLACACLTITSLCSTLVSRTTQCCPGVLIERNLAEPGELLRVLTIVSRYSRRGLKVQDAQELVNKNNTQHRDYHLSHFTNESSNVTNNSALLQSS